MTPSALSATRRPLLLPIYFGVVTLSGLGVLVIAGAAALPALAAAPLVFWLFAAYVLAAELFPVRVARAFSNETITTSTGFAYATALAFGIGPALLVHALASVVADSAGRAAPHKLLFNAAQYTLSLGAGGLVAHALGEFQAAGPIPFTEADLPAIALGGVVFFLVNQALAGAARTLEAIGAGEERPPLLWAIRENLGFRLLLAAVQLAGAPVLVVVAAWSPWLTPLLALPLIAVHKAGVESARNAHQALHDGLTGLPNRTLFRDRVEQAIRVAARDRAPLAVLLLDLDRFKNVNDTLGHHKGDLLLGQIEPRLRSAVRDSDTIARFGGDEFAILLPTIRHAQDALDVARKLLETLEEPFEVEGLALDVSASVGLACYPEHGEDVDALVRRADVATYWAKNAADQQTAVYAAHLDEYDPARLSLVAELRRGIACGELVLRYQPQFELSTGRVLGVEALVRWSHPVHGLMTPDSFIPLAERTGLIKPLTSCVLTKTLAQWRRWADRGLELNIAINLPARGLLDRRLPDEVAAHLAVFDVPAERLTLEVTESMVMEESGRAVAALDRLNEMGVRIAIDDFGTGFSSLTRLKRLPVSQIKVDRSFVMGMGDDRDDAVIVRSTVHLGHHLGLEVVAEGVETPEVRDELAELGCDAIQGYLVSRPVPPESIAERARDGRWRPLVAADATQLPLTPQAGEPVEAAGAGDRVEAAGAVVRPAPSTAVASAPDGASA